MANNDLIYSQSGGTLRAGDDDQNAFFVKNLYAGRLDAKNKPDQDHRKNRGPLPRGFYRIGRPFNHPTWISTKSESVLIHA